MKKIVLSFILFFNLYSQDVVTKNKRCFLCHGKEDYKIIEDGREKSLYVSPGEYYQNVHKNMLCTNCHYDVVTIPHLRKPKKIHCLQCHYAGNVVGAPVKEMPEKYKESIHAKAKEKGKKAPDCIDCHTIHYVRYPMDTLSTIHKKNIPVTCGKCHAKIKEEYLGSIHGYALLKGIMETAVCSDCHREHDILPPEDPRSALNPKNVVHTCERCHADVTIMKKYGVPVKQVEAFKESFHGVALEYGVVRAANCVSCHGSHYILPSRDPISPIHPENLAKTCGKCHPGASKNVAKGRYHIIAEEKEAGIVYYVYNFFKWFTLIVIFGLVVHIILDLTGRTMKTVKTKKGK